MASRISDFTFAKHTAIISDLHLCEAEPVHPKYPLWKKYKTKQFFFDDVFGKFLQQIEEKANGESVELILNGDIFDFDSVTSIPAEPSFRVSWLEKKRGLYPRAERSKYKIKVILRDHTVFVAALRAFILKGHRVIFVIGNHDLELHFPEVQEVILEALDLSSHDAQRVRFADWFYISNQDTLIEHGNQYDPYCVCEDPVNPYVRGYNYTSLKLPFGNLACRYIMNGLGFFNPHVDTNYIMSLKAYVLVFLRYMARAQPLLVWTWLWGGVVTFGLAFRDRLFVPIRNPLRIEDRVVDIAARANAEPRMVRELKELFVEPAASSPMLLMKELWLDRAFIILIAFLVIFEFMGFVRSIFHVSFLWTIVPFFAFFPFFLFYSKSITSLVSSYKEPDERILAMSSAITKVNRVVYGHTHRIRHEIIGSVEHLNSGCWSPAFVDIECTKSIELRNFIWITTIEGEPAREAKLLKFEPKT